MVGSMKCFGAWAVVGVAMVVGLGPATGSVLAQIDASDKQPRRGNQTDSMRGEVRRNAAQPEGESTPLFRTGLEGGFEGVYKFMSAIEYSEQTGEEEESRVTTSENDTMVLEIASRRVRPDGLAPVVASFRRVSSRVETPDGPVSVDFDLTRDLPENADELTGTDAMLPALKRAQVRMLIDANGNVTSIEGLPDPSEIAGDDDEIPSGLFGMLDETRFAVLISKVFNGEGGVERSRSEAGGPLPTWTTIEEVELGESGTLVVTRSWSPKPAGGEGVEARGRFSIAVEGPAAPNDAAPRPEVASYQGVGRLLWRDEGGLAYLNSSEALAMQWTLGSTTIRTTQESSTTIDRVEE